MAPHTYVVRTAQELTDSSNIGVVLWLVLILVVNALWISMDIWLRKNGHEMLTNEFREGLQNPFLGPLLTFLTFGTVTAFIFHMFVEKNPKGM